MGSAAFTSPLSTPMPFPSPSVLTSPLPAPPASAPTLGLTVWTEPVGVALGETVTSTLRLEDPADPISWPLVALFRYEEAAKRWERLLTIRRWEGEDLVLTAKVEEEEEGTFAVALSTQSDIGNYAQP